MTRKSIARPLSTKQQAKAFYDDANAIYLRLHSDALNLLNELDLIYGSKKKTIKQKWMAKSYIKIATQLARQSLHVFNTEENFFLLACLGCRSLIEHEINAKYVFFHPKHHGDMEWTSNLAKDYWRITRVRSANKAKLGGVSIHRRAKDIRKLSTYNRNFSHLTGITHGTANSVLLIKDEHLYDGVAWIGLHSVVLLNNVIDYIAKFHKIERDMSIEDDIRELVTLYR